jgi:hypothetical protein
VSSHRERFVLKGGLLFLVYLGEAIRPTRDVDLLGYGDPGAEALARTISESCAVDVEPDGLNFDSGSIRVTAIRPEDPYGGQRVTVTAFLGSARLRIQVDVGFGDAVTPEPEWLDHPRHARRAGHRGCRGGSPPRAALADRRGATAVASVAPP